jgi:hypothetical protein
METIKLTNGERIIDVPKFIASKLLNIGWTLVE